MINEDTLTLMWINNPGANFLKQKVLWCIVQGADIYSIITTWVFRHFKLFNDVSHLEQKNKIIRHLYIIKFTDSLNKIYILLQQQDKTLQLSQALGHGYAEL